MSFRCLSLSFLYLSISHHLPSLNWTLVGKKLAVLGYTFKKNTDDTREYPALECIKYLLDDRPRELAVFDLCYKPAVVKDETRILFSEHVLKENRGPIEFYADAYQACDDSHGALILTECQKFNSSTPSKSPQLGPKPSTTSPAATKKGPTDPRPFERLEPTELEILSLQRYLNHAHSISDPLQRFEPEPECEANCDKCAAEKTASASLLEGTKRQENEQLDWARIAYHLQKPRWVFDGRNVLDVKSREALGVRVESVGKVGYSERLPRANSSY